MERTSSRVRDHMMRVLSREAVKIMSGFSAEVAMAVTSPLLVVAVVVSVGREARCGERERERARSAAAAPRRSCRGRLQYALVADEPVVSKYGSVSAGASTRGATEVQLTIPCRRAAPTLRACGERRGRFAEVSNEGRKGQLVLQSRVARN